MIYTCNPVLQLWMYWTNDWRWVSFPFSFVFFSFLFTSFFFSYHFFQHSCVFYFLLFSFFFLYCSLPLLRMLSLICYLLFWEKMTLLVHICNIVLQHNVYFIGTASMLLLFITIIIIIGIIIIIIIIAKNKMLFWEKNTLLVHIM